MPTESAESSGTSSYDCGDNRKDETMLIDCAVVHTVGRSQLLSSRFKRAVLVLLTSVNQAPIRTRTLNGPTDSFLLYSIPRNDAYLRGYDMPQCS